MSKHEHKWETLHEVLPTPPPAEMTVIDPATGEETSAPFDRSYVEGEVGYEMDEPYRVEYCGCGEKRIKPMSKKDAEMLGIRSGRIVVDELTVVARSDSDA